MFLPNIALQRARFFALRCKSMVMTYLIKLGKAVPTFYQLPQLGVRLARFLPSLSYQVL